MNDTTTPPTVITEVVEGERFRLEQSSIERSSFSPDLRWEISAPAFFILFAGLTAEQYVAVREVWLRETNCYIMENELKENTSVILLKMSQIANIAGQTLVVEYGEYYNEDGLPLAQIVREESDEQREDGRSYEYAIYCRGTLLTVLERGSVMKVPHFVQTQYAKMPALPSMEKQKEINDEIAALIK